MKKVSNNNKGSMYIEVIIILAVIFSLVYSFMVLPELFTKKQNLDYMANAIVRSVEINGEIGSETIELLDNLKVATGISPSLVWNGNFNSDGKIQLLERFSLTLSTTARIKIIEPSFSNPVYIDVPIKKTVYGISEVYWKQF